MHKSFKLAVGCTLIAVTVLLSGIVAKAQESNPGEGETMHVLVGKSVIINVQAALTRVLSSNPQVVETLVTSPTQVVVEGLSAGSSSLILWDGNGHSQILDVVVDLDVSALRTAMQRTYPDSKLDVQADGGKLILTGSVPDPKLGDDLAKMASAYSGQVVNSLTVGAPHEKQVLLEVKFAEVDRSLATAYGVNIFSTGLGNTIGQTTTGQFGGSGAVNIQDIFGPGLVGSPFQSQWKVNDLLNVFLFNPELHLGTVVRDLQQKNILQILAEPNLMAVNGRKASFLAGGEFPFPIVQPGQGFTAVTIEFKPFGVRLDFTGVIENDTIRLHVAPEVSTLDFSNSLQLSGFVVPAISTRKAETDIELRDGQSFGIAGLLDNRATVQLSKVPGIGDIPVLGQLFKSRNVSKNNSELVVLVTPHIVDPVKVAGAPPAPKLVTPFLGNSKFDKDIPGNKEVTKPAEAPATK